MLYFQFSSDNTNFCGKHCLVGPIKAVSEEAILLAWAISCVWITLVLMEVVIYGQTKGIF